MGADGGIKLVSISEIKSNWTDIKTRLKDSCNERLDYCGQYEVKYLKDYIKEIKRLPNKIDKLSNNEICKLFNFLRSCDCPYVHDDFMITAYGDNIPIQMSILSESIGGISIETWT